MKYKNIVFDVDGTLIDTEEAILISLQKVVSTMKGTNVDLIDLRFALGIPGDAALIKLSITDLDYATSLWHDFYQQYSSNNKVFDGIEPLLQQLKSQGYSLGIITSKTRKEYHNDPGLSFIYDYFDHKICADDSLRHKPNPEPMYKYMEISGAMPDEILYIGDTIYDMQCAKGANVDCALALWGCKNPQSIKADYYFKCPNEIISTLVKDFNRSTS